MLVLPFRPVTATDLESWLRELGIGARACAPLAGDLSQRRYFRILLDGGDSLLAAHYPESLRATMARFVAARSLLAGAGVRVPEIRESSSERGWMLLEDLGAATLFEAGDRTQEERTAWFVAAAQAAARIAGLDAKEVAGLGNPPLDAALLRRELEPTFEFLFDPAGLTGLPGERLELSAALDELCARLGSDPLVPCHRDYMSRNLIPVAESVAVIDFQDLRLGPPAYDMASLLNDSYFPDRSREAAILAERWRSGPGREAYARAVVQRSLKAAGTFARFAARGNPRHVPLIAPTLARAVPHLALLPETAAVFPPLRGWWTARLAPGCFC